MHRTEGHPVCWPVYTTARVAGQLIGSHYLPLAPFAGNSAIRAPPHTHTHNTLRNVCAARMWTEWQGHTDY